MNYLQCQDFNIYVTFNPCINLDNLGVCICMFLGRQ